MAITETNLKPKQKLQINGYRWIGRPRCEKLGGGIGFLIKNSLVGRFTVEPFHNSTIEDLWITCCLQNNQRLTIGTYYGKQESCSNRLADEEFSQLNAKITELLIRHENLLLVGDFNAKIGNDHEGIPQNNNYISRNGKLLRDMVKTCNLTLLNSTQACKGLWTRVNTKNHEERSVLDYALSSKSLETQVKSMTIDEEGHHRLEGANPTDHNTITLQVSTNIAHQTPIYEPQWKLRDANWPTFTEQLNQELQGFQGMADPDQELNQLHGILMSTAEQVIGKTRGFKSTDSVMRTEKVQACKEKKRHAKKAYDHSLRIGEENDIHNSLKKYRESQRDLIDAINTEKAEMVERMLKKMNQDGGTNSKQFWNIRRKGKKNNLEDMWAIKSEEGTPLYNPVEVKNETAEYYERLYSPRSDVLYSEEWSNKVEDRMKELERCHLFEEQPLNQPLQFKEVQHVINTLPLNKSCGPDNVPNEFLKFGGELLHQKHSSVSSTTYFKRRLYQINGSIVAL